MFGKVDGFMVDVFYQIVIVVDDIGVVIYQIIVEVCIQDVFGQGYVDGGGDVLIQWFGGDFDFFGVVIFGMVCCVCVQLLELMQLCYGYVVIIQYVIDGIDQY